jgi:hypothetical protein
MTAAPGKAPKKEKEKRQTPEERLEALRYNHMMYGPTENETRMKPPKVDYGASYLKHPKFQALMAAFRKGTAFKFEVTAADKVSEISTDGSHILFEGRILFYSRQLNRYENNLLLDREVATQLQTVDPLVHLVFAVLRSFPEMGAPQITYLRKQFYMGIETLDTGIEQHGANMLIGPYKHNNSLEKPKR